MSRLPLEQIAPMLASDLRNRPQSDRDRIWSDPAYIAEEKFNGIRAILHIGKAENRISTRVISKLTGFYTERTDHFQHLRDLPIGFLDGTILDGELIMDKPRMFTGDTTACGTLACTMALCNASPEKAFVLQQEEGFASYYAFDIIRHQGKSLEEMPFERRRVYLDGVFGEIIAKGIDAPNLKLSPLVSTDKQRFYKQLIAAGKEGIMLKRLDGLYQHTGRSKAMLKVKRYLTVDGYIIGSTPGRNGNAGLIGSLLIGAQDASSGKLCVIAGVQPYDLSLGPKHSNLRRAMTIQRDGKPCLAPAFYNRVVELGAFQWNKNKRLMHAKILRFRQDKTVEECLVDFSGTEG